MPIITKPGSVVKDTANSFSLSKSSLAALSVVSSDAWFSQTSNWKKVRVNYISSVGNQFISVIFDATQANPTGTFYAMSPCRDNFEVFNIVIEDFNRGSLKIDSSLLNKSEFSVSFGSAPVSAVFTRDFSNPSSAIPGEYMSGTGLGNNISNNVLNLYVPDSGYNGGLYYAMNPFPYSFASGKTYKIRLTFSEAPSSNARFQATWDNGNGSLYRVFTQEELSQGFVELTGVTSATTYFNMSCNTTDAAAAYIRFSKYEVFEV